MKTIPLAELLTLITPLPYSAIRTHPSIDVGNGDGPQPMLEISSERTGGGWYDVAYVHAEPTRLYLAHAANVLPEFVSATRRLMVGLSGVSTPDCEFYDGLAGDAEDELRSALAKATAVPARVPA